MRERAVAFVEVVAVGVAGVDLGHEAFGPVGVVPREALDARVLVAIVGTNGDVLGASLELIEAQDAPRLVDAART